MAAQVYEDLEYTEIYVHLKNIGDETIYPILIHFTLLTKTGQTILPSPYRTSIIENHFYSGFLAPNAEREGFIIFNTKDLPKAITYKDFSGNEISLNLP